jgi:hypothetical protein
VGVPGSFRSVRPSGLTSGPLSGLVRLDAMLYGRVAPSVAPARPRCYCFQEDHRFGYDHHFGGRLLFQVLIPAPANSITINTVIMIVDARLGFVTDDPPAPASRYAIIGLSLGRFAQAPDYLPTPVS